MQLHVAHLISGALLSRSCARHTPHKVCRLHYNAIVSIVLLNQEFSLLKSLHIEINWLVTKLSDKDPHSFPLLKYMSHDL